MTRSRQHVRRSEQEWREIVQRFEASGQSQRQFCKSEDITLASFARWRRRLQATGTPAAIDSGFVELATPSVAPSWSIELELPGGSILRVRP